MDSNLQDHQRKTRLERAREWLIAHPNDTNAQAALGSGVSAGSIQNARRALIFEGVLQKPRRSVRGLRKAPSSPVAGTEEPTEQKVPSPPSKMLDHTAMTALNDMADADLDDIDDDEVYKRMLKQCIRFAFDGDLHPDTRMSASQMWGKLRDQAKSKDLGPGVPLTFEAGVARLADLHRACGVKMVIAAVNLAFEEAPREQAPNDQAQAAGGPPQAPSPA